MARTKPRKWIAAEIATLDPRTDYQRIWELANVYYVNDFLMDYVYAFTFPRFLVTLRGTVAVLRGDEGKICTAPNRRMDDTSRHMLTWWENGPDHSATQRSVKSLNNLHGYYAKKFPGHFAFNEDYVYTLCYEGLMMHRLKLSLGMPGYDEKLRIATWEFWSRMAELFVIAEDGSPLRDFPKDFDAMNDYMDWYENTQWPANPLGAQVADVCIRPFAERHFPKALHGVAHVMVTSLYPDWVLRVHDIKAPPRFARWVVRRGFRLGLTMGEKVAPDPEVSLPEIHRRRKADQGSTRPATKREIRQASRCPVDHEALGITASDGHDQVLAPEIIEAADARANA